MDNYILTDIPQILLQLRKTVILILNNLLFICLYHGINDNTVIK
jgi:hypothetical protein